MIKKTLMNVLNVLLKPKEFFKYYKPETKKEIAVYALVVSILNPLCFLLNLLNIILYVLLALVVFKLILNFDTWSSIFIIVYSFTPKALLGCIPMLNFISIFWMCGLIYISMESLFPQVKKKFKIMVVSIFLLFLLVPL